MEDSGFGYLCLLGDAGAGASGSKLGALVFVCRELYDDRSKPVQGFEEIRASSAVLVQGPGNSNALHC